MLNVYLQNKISGIHIMNTAVSGNNSQALRERFAKDVLSYTADKEYISVLTEVAKRHDCEVSIFIRNFLNKWIRRIFIMG